MTIRTPAWREEARALLDSKLVLRPFNNPFCGTPCHECAEYPLKFRGRTVTPAVIAMQVKLGRTLTVQEDVRSICGNYSCVRPEHLVAYVAGDPYRAKFFTDARVHRLHRLGYTVLDITRHFKVDSTVVRKILEKDMFYTIRRRHY